MSIEQKARGNLHIQSLQAFLLAGCVTLAAGVPSELQVTGFRISPTLAGDFLVSADFPWTPALPAPAWAFYERVAPF